MQRAGMRSSLRAGMKGGRGMLSYGGGSRIPCNMHAVCADALCDSTDALRKACGGAAPSKPSSTTHHPGSPRLIVRSLPTLLTAYPQAPELMPAQLHALHACTTTLGPPRLIVHTLRVPYAPRPPPPLYLWVACECSRPPAHISHPL